MIRVEDLTVRAGAFQLRGIGFEIEAGEHGVLMGKTGCGKTTVLEAVCGLKAVASGSIRLMDRDVTRLPAAQRGIGFVPQDATLFSTRTVRQHLSFGPRVQGWERDAIKRRVADLAAELGLENLLDRKPHGLSGGERQRVALGRALAVRPRVLCLDEPLSALDEDTHGEMVALLERVTREGSITTLHITHSRREAEMIADRIFHLVDGRVVPDG